MEYVIYTQACKKGELFPLFITPYTEEGNFLLGEVMPPLSAGDILGNDGPVFRMTGYAWFKAGKKAALRPWPMLEALRNVEKGSMSVKISRCGYAIAIITLSDKGVAGIREDFSGPALAKKLTEIFPGAWIQNFLLGDDYYQLRALLSRLAFMDGYDLICSTGGTGLSPRDITPQATEKIVEIPLPGFSEAMRAKSLQITPHAIISRSVAGIAAKSLIINLPGSLKAVVENLEAIAGALPHALKKIHGDSADCGG